MELSTLARWTIRPRLMSIPGVANVAIWGQRDRQLQVLVDPDRLRSHNLTLADVVTAAREGTAVAAGGYLETPQQRLAIAHAPAVASTDDLRQIIVRANAPRAATPALGPPGRPIRSASATSPTWWKAFHRRSAMPSSIDGDGLMLIVEKQPDGNTLRGDARRRGRDGRVEAGPAGRRHRHDDLPAGDVHRDVAAEPEPRAPDRLRAGGARPDRLPLRLAHRAHQHHRDPAVADRRGAGAPLPWRHPRHHGDRRPDHRPRRSRGRRHHRRREHRAPPAAERRGRQPALRRSRSSWTPRSRSAAPWSTAASS